MLAKKNRILVDKNGIFLWLLYLIIYIAFMGGSIYLFSGAENNLAKIIIGIILYSFFSIIFFIVSFFLNRACNYVYLFNEKLRRIGFLFGFKKEIPICKIKRIERIFLHIDGDFYVLVEESGNYLERIRKESAIFIPCNKKGYDFIRMFWGEEIPEYNN